MAIATALRDGNDGFDASRQFADGEIEIGLPTAAWQLPASRLAAWKPPRA